MTIHEFKFPIQKSWRGREEPKPAEESMEKKIIRLEAEIDSADHPDMTNKAKTRLSEKLKELDKQLTNLINKKRGSTNVQIINTE